MHAADVRTIEVTTAQSLPDGPHGLTYDVEAECAVCVDGGLMISPSVRGKANRTNLPAYRCESEARRARQRHRAQKG